MIVLRRRGLIVGAASLFLAPAIVRASNLMPISTAAIAEPLVLVGLQNTGIPFYPGGYNWPYWAWLPVSKARQLSRNPPAETAVLVNWSGDGETLEVSTHGQDWQHKASRHR